MAHSRMQPSIKQHRFTVTPHSRPFQYPSADQSQPLSANFGTFLKKTAFGLASTFLYAAPYISNPPSPTNAWEAVEEAWRNFNNFFLEMKLADFLAPNFMGGESGILWREGCRPQRSASQSGTSQLWAFPSCRRPIAKGRSKQTIINVNVEKYKWTTANYPSSVKINFLLGLYSVLDSAYTRHKLNLVSSYTQYKLSIPSVSRTSYGIVEKTNKIILTRL